MRKRFLFRVFAIFAVAAACLAGAVPATAAPQRQLEGGIGLLFDGGGRCVGAFNAKRGATGFLLTHGACGKGGQIARSADGVPIGPVAGSEFPDRTSGLIRVTNVKTWVQGPWVTRGPQQPPLVINGSKEAPIGAALCMYSPVSGIQCGTLQAKNQTVNFPDGTLHGLSRATLCVQPGDLGAPVFSGDQAQGHIVGGSGGGSSRCVAYFQPINRVLAAHGLTLLTGTGS